MAVQVISFERRRTRVPHPADSDMGTLIVGVLVVVVAAAGFAFSLFGRRPPLQPATVTGASSRSPVRASRVAGTGPTRSGRRSRSPRYEPVAEEVGPRLHVEVPTAVRVRSAFILGLGVITAAAVIGVFLSLIIVGGFTLIG